MNANKISLNIDPLFYRDFLSKEARENGCGISHMASKIISDGFQLPTEIVVTMLLRAALDAIEYRERTKPRPQQSA